MQHSFSRNGDIDLFPSFSCLKVPEPEKAQRHAGLLRQGSLHVSGLPSALPTFGNLACTGAQKLFFAWEEKKKEKDFTHNTLLLFDIYFS